MPKKSLARRIARWIAISIVSFMLIVFTAMVVASLWVTEDRIRRVLETQVAEQTGGRLTLDHVHVSLWTGMSLKNVKFEYPTPNANRISSTEYTTVFTLDELDARWRLGKLLLLRLEIERIKFINPKIYLTMVDGDSFLSRLSAYRQAKFPSEPKPIEPAKPAPKTLREFIPPALLSLALPLIIRIEDVGFEDLEINFEQWEKNRRVSKIDLTGLDLRLDAKAWATSHELTTKVASGLKPIYLNGETWDPKIKKPHKFALTAHLDQTLFVQNLEFLEEKLNLEILDLDIRSNKFRNLRFDLGAVIKTDRKYQTLRLESFSLNILNAASIGGAARLEFEDGKFENIGYVVEPTATLDFDKVRSLTAVIVPGLVAGGKVTLGPMTVKGRWEKSKPAMEQIPATKMAIHAARLSLLWPEKKVQLEPSELSVDADMQEGSAGKVRLKMEVPRLTIGTSNMKLDLQSARVSSTSQFSAVSQVLNQHETVLDIGAIAVSKKNRPTIRVPLRATIKALDASVEKVGEADVFLAMGELLSINAKVDGSKWPHLHVNAGVEAGSLEKLHALFEPVINQMVVPRYRPHGLGGSVSWNLDAKAKIPKSQANLGELITDHPTIKSNLIIDQLRFALPLNQSSLSGANVRITLEADHKSQRLSLDQKIKLFKTKLTDTSSEINATTEVGVEDQFLNISLINELALNASSAVTPASLMAQSDIKLEVNSGVKKTSWTGKKPMSLNDVTADISTRLSGGRDASLKQLEIRVPGLGAMLKAYGRTMFDDHLVPQSGETKINFEVDAGKTQGIVEGFSTQGRMNFGVDLRMRPGKVFDVDGILGFQHFSFTIPRPEGGSPKFAVEDVHGEVPIKQRVGAALFRKSTKSKDQPDPELDAQIATFLSSSQDHFVKGTNAANIVDYPNIRPFYPGRQPLSIRKLETSDLVFLDTELDLEMKPEWVAINQLVTSFLGGKIQAAMQLALDPAPRAIRLTFHAAKLNSRRMIDRFPHLVERAKTWDLLGSPDIDATTHFKYDFISGDMAGDIEIPTIGKEQLRMILFYLDPEEKNPTISQIRTALNFGEVRKVSIPIRNGQIGLEVDVRLLKAPIPTPKLSRFPLAELVRNYRQSSATKAKAEEKNQKNPIEATSNQSKIQTEPAGGKL